MKEENNESVFDSIKRIKKEKRLSDVIKAQQGGSLKPRNSKTIMDFEQFVKHYDKDPNDELYNIKRAYEIYKSNPTKFEDPEIGIASKESDGWHFSTVDPSTGIFLKHKNHPTINKELQWYNSPEGKSFKERFELDSLNDYFRYVPKRKQGGILYAQQGVSLKNYFNKAVDGAIESLKLPHKAMQMYGDVVGSGYSAPGQIANKAAQTVAREVAKRTHNLTENDLPKAKYESHSETFNRLISPKRDMNFIESLGLDLVGDPTTVIAGKKVSSKINKSIKPRQANLFGKKVSKIESTPLLHESDVAAGNKQWDDWVRSDEYAKRRSATTGETVEEANKQGVKLTERKWGYKNNTNASDNNVGGYSPKVLIGKDIISIGKGLTKDEAVQVFNHEYGHMRSPAAKSGSDKFYKDYPTIKFEEKDWGSKRMADYQNLPEEQQVRFMRTNFKIREDLGLPTKEMQPLTEAQMNNWFDNFNLKSLRSQQGYDDILEFIETGVVSNKLNRNNLREYLNKAWTGAAVGTGASIGLNEIQKQKQGGVINKIQYAQQGTKVKLNSNDIADIRESEDLKELRRQLKMPIDLKVRNYADNTSTIHTINRPKSDVETRSLNRDTQAKKIANNDIVLKNKQTVLARKERIANSSKGGSENSIGGSTALGDKARIFKDDPNSFVDDYLNPAVAIGSAIDNFNDTWINKYTGPTTIGEKTLSAGILGASLYGAKGSLKGAETLTRQGMDVAKRVNTNAIKSAVRLGKETWKNTSDLDNVTRLSNAVKSGVFGTPVEKDLLSVNMFNLSPRNALRKMKEYADGVKPGGTFYGGSMSTDSHSSYLLQLERGLDGKLKDKWGVFNTGESVGMNTAGFKTKLNYDALPEKVKAKITKKMSDYKKIEDMPQSSPIFKGMDEDAIETFKNHHHPLKNMLDNGGLALDDGTLWRVNAEYGYKLAKGMDERFSKVTDKYNLSSNNSARLNGNRIEVPVIMAYKKGSLGDYLGRFIKDKSQIKPTPTLSEGISNLFKKKN